ncbi:MAG: ABC transporter substrate-binding protein [Deltaproteobacteria bacterium]|nr:ABC transporter substrate-binding protein [Deltaproteobacteria bacterium]
MNPSSGKRSRNRLHLLLTALFASFSFTVWAESALPQSDKVTVAVITLSLNNLPIYVAQEKGFFTQENLFAEVVLLGASTRAIPALIGGSVHLSASAAMTTMRAVEKGAALKIVGGLVNGPTYDLISLPKYKTMKDLKGSTIGVTGLVTSDTILLKEMLKANGLEYPRDYSMLAIGGGFERWVALQSRNIAAGILNPPYTFAAEEAGFNNLGSTVKYTPDFTQTVLNVRAAWANENRAVLTRFMKAILRADRWIYAQKEDTVRIIAKRLKFSDKHSEASWRYFTENNIIPKVGEVNLRGMDKVLQLLAEDGTLKSSYPSYEKYMDNTYLAEAKRSLQ